MTVAGRVRVSHGPPSSACAQATGVDGGDPSGSIHTRCKLDLGRRLGNGFLFDAGALASSALSEGPVFASSAAGDSSSTPPTFSA